MSTLHEEVWGPTVVGGRGRSRWRRIALAGGIVLTVLAVAAVGVGYALWRTVQNNIERVPVETLAVPERGQPLNILIVGSDSREGLTEEERILYTLGLEEITGQRSDTMLLLSLSRGGGASIVSFPRDLRVDDDGRARKLTETFADGPANVVEVLQTNTGVPVHHYVELSVLGFVGVVDALGGVDICLDEPLVDPRSGANFTEPGCYHMGPREALAYVRSREGARGDFERVDRQQTFMRAVIGKASSLGVIVDLPKLFDVVGRVARNVTTDMGLGFSEMRALAVELRAVAGGSVPMVVVPSYVQSIDGKSYVLAYPPGANALYGDLLAGRPPAPRGLPEERAATHVAVWSAGRGGGADLVVRTLQWVGFSAGGAGAGPVDGGPVTRVFSLPGQEAVAGWVAATLGVGAEPLPDGVSAQDGAAVVVVVGDDATG